MTPTVTHRHARRSAWSTERGASLIETVVALGLFALTAAMMSNFLAEHVRHSSSNNLHSVAYSLAAEALEGARALDLADVTSQTASHDEGGVSFTVATSVEDDTPQPNLKTITATVTWTEQDGEHHVSVPVVYTAIARI